MCNGNAYKVCEWNRFSRSKAIITRFGLDFLSYKFLGKIIECRPLEERFLSLIPSGVIHNCVLMGDGMSSLQILVSFNTNKETGTLQGAALAWCRMLGSTALTPSNLIDYADSIVRDELHRIAVLVCYVLSSHYIFYLFASPYL